MATFSENYFWFLVFDSSKNNNSKIVKKGARNLNLKSDNYALFSKVHVVRFMIGMRNVYFKYFAPIFLVQKSVLSNAGFDF
jgi:hypothetical protein